MKWLVFWKDGDVSLWDMSFVTAAQLATMRNVVDAQLVPAMMAVRAAAWWMSDAGSLHREFAAMESAR